MNKTYYAALDSLIIEGIESGKNTFAKIFSGPVVVESVNIADRMGREPFRVVDGRLQVLRKAEKIFFTKSAGWTITRG